MIEVSRIQSFDVAFCYRDTMLSEAIQVATGSRFSHTAHFVFTNDGLMVYDAQIDGFKPKPFAEWNEKYGYEFTVLTNPNHNASIGNKCLSLTKEITGKPYDAFSLLVRKPFNIGRKVHNVVRKENKPDWEANEKRQKNRFFCSEATAYVMQRPNIDLSPAELFIDLVLDGWVVKK